MRIITTAVVSIVELLLDNTRVIRVFRMFRRETSVVLEDIRFISDGIMYDTLSEGKINKNKIGRAFSSTSTLHHAAGTLHCTALRVCRDSSLHCSSDAPPIPDPGSPDRS
ncbi:unnamed protein product [Laminaria digitata]